MKDKYCAIELVSQPLKRAHDQRRRRIVIQIPAAAERAERIEHDDVGAEFTEQRFKVVDACLVKNRSNLVAFEEGELLYFPIICCENLEPSQIMFSDVV